MVFVDINPANKFLVAVRIVGQNFAAILRHKPHVGRDLFDSLFDRIANTVSNQLIHLNSFHT